MAKMTITPPLHTCVLQLNIAPHPRKSPVMKQNSLVVPEVVTLGRGEVSTEWEQCKGSPLGGWNVVYLDLSVVIRAHRSFKVLL